MPFETNNIKPEKILDLGHQSLEETFPNPKEVIISSLQQEKDFKKGKLGFGYNTGNNQFFSRKAPEEFAKEAQEKFNDIYKKVFSDLSLTKADLEIDNFNENNPIIQHLANFMIHYININESNFTHEMDRNYILGLDLSVNLLFEVIKAQYETENPFKDKNEFIEFMQIKWFDDYKYTNLNRSYSTQPSTISEDIALKSKKFKDEKYNDALKYAAKIVNFAHFFNMDNNAQYQKNYCDIKEWQIYGQQLIKLNKEPSIVYRGMNLTERSGKSIDAEYFFAKGKNRGIHSYLVDEWRLNLPKVNRGFDGIESVHNVISTSNKFSYALRFGNYVSIIMKDKSISTDEYDKVPNYQYEEAMFSIKNEDILGIIEMKRPLYKGSLEVLYNFSSESKLIINPKNQDMFLKLKEHIKDNPDSTRFLFNERVINYDCQLNNIINNTFTKKIVSNDNIVEYETNIEYKEGSGLNGNENKYNFPYSNERGRKYYNRSELRELNGKEGSNKLFEKLNNEMDELGKIILGQLEEFKKNNEVDSDVK